MKDKILIILAVLFVSVDLYGCKTLTSKVPDTCPIIDIAKIEACKLACDKQDKLAVGTCQNLCEYTGDIAEIVTKEKLR